MSRLASSSRASSSSAGTSRTERVDHDRHDGRGDAGMTERGERRGRGSSRRRAPSSARSATPMPRPGRSPRRPAWPRGRSIATSRTRCRSSSPPSWSPTSRSSTWVTTLPSRAGTDTVEDNLTDAVSAARGPARPDPAAGARDRCRPRARRPAPTDPRCGRRHRCHLVHPRRSRPIWRQSSGSGRIRADVDPQEAAIVILATLFGLAAGQTMTDGTLYDRHLVAAIRLFVRGIEPGHAAP